MSGPIPRQQLEDHLDATHVLQERFERRDSVFSIYDVRRANGGRRVLVKEPRYWTGLQAEIAYSTLQSCRDAAARLDEPHFVARPLWWGADPPFLCVEWIDGKPLRNFMADSVKHDEPASLVLDAVSSAGELLARFHAATADWPIENDGSVGRARGPWPQLARSLAGPKLASTEFPVRSFIDPNEGNIIIDETGRSWLIDLPARVERRPAQWDLALLAYSLSRAAVRTSFRAHTNTSFGALYEAVQSGYSGRLPEPLGSEQSVGLFYSYLACEAARHLRGKWRRTDTMAAKLRLLVPASQIAGHSFVAVSQRRLGVGRPVE